MRTHDYGVQVDGTGAAQGGTTAYRAYSREHAVKFNGGARLTASSGTMTERPDGGGAFTEVVLRPDVRVAEVGMVSAAERLHEQANRKCFIANSVNFPVRHEPEVAISG